MIGRKIKFKKFGICVTGYCVSYQCDDTGRAEVLHVVDSSGREHKVYPHQFVEELYE